MESPRHVRATSRITTTSRSLRLEDPYPVPSGTARFEEVIRRSRFVSCAGRAASRESALRFVQSVRDRFPGATHHCWAFNAGPPGSTARIGSSDAGEPRGTAGMPILTAVLHSGVGETVVVCARYYGGVKLGTGGLARAYARGAKGVLAACPTERKVNRVAVLITVPYEASGRIDPVLRKLDAKVLTRDFGTDVRYRVQIPVVNRSSLVGSIAGATGGRGRVEDSRE